MSSSENSSDSEDSDYDPFDGDKEARRRMATDICRASRKGDFGKLIELLSSWKGRAAINDLQPNEVPSATALQLASREGHVQCVRILLEAGAEVNKVNNSGESALWLACYYGRAYCARLLLNAGADVDLPDNYNRTPLLMASWNNKLDCVQLLLERGANVRATDNEDRSALFMACRPDRREVAKLLLQRGAAIDEDWTMFISYSGDNIGVTAMQFRDAMIEELGGKEAVHQIYTEWLSNRPGRRTKAARAPIPLLNFAHMAAALRALLE